MTPQASFIHELVTESQLYSRDHAGSWLRVLRSVDSPDKAELISVFLERYKEVHANRLKQQTLRQADWRTKCSRRPQRNNHHDSWSIREGYTRVNRSYSSFTDAHPIASAWSALRLQQIRRESSLTRLEFMKNNGFRIRPLDKQRHI
jgi:hypothetical protein